MAIGVSILDLLALPLPPGAATVVPPPIRALFDALAAVDLSSSTTAATTFHYGVLKPVADVFDVEDAARGWFVQGAGFDRGVRFQLAITRNVAGAAQNIEPQPGAWQLDLFLEQVSIFVPFLKAARLIPAAGTTPAHLEPDPAAPPVRIVGDALLRFAPGATGAVTMSLIDAPDPLLPAAPTGSVATMQFAPPHFFIASSAVGMTVRKLTFDASPAYTPAAIMARSQGPDWTGLAISEALLYLPRDTPLVGNLVLGVRDVLLGDPFGMQGEVLAQWGTDAISATTVEVWQAQGDAQDSFAPITLAAENGALDRTVVIEDGRPLRFFAQVSAPDAVVRWVLPDGSAAQGVVTPEFRARAGDTLVVVRSETAGGGDSVDLPEIRHHFVATPAAAAQIRAAWGSASLDNVVTVAGARELVVGAGIRLHAVPAPSADAEASWEAGSGAAARSVADADDSGFALDAALGLPEEGRTDVLLTDAVGRRRRLRIETLPGASLLFGAADGVFDAAGAPLQVQAIERTAVLDVFHDDGTTPPAPHSASGSGLALEVPVDALARVTVAATAPPPALPARHARVRMVFDEANPSHEGADIEAVEQLLAAYPEGRLVLIGRCDDVGETAYNAVLARERAAALGERLVGLGVDAARIIRRGEQDDPLTGWAGEGAPPDPAALGVPEDQRGADWYAFLQEPAHPAPNSAEESVELRLRREEYRRVDVYAEGVAVRAGAPPAESLAAELRRAWVPGEDGAPSPAPSASTPPLMHSASVRVAWDSPTASSLADFVPTLAEITVAYQSERLSDPANMPAELNGTQVEVVDGSANHVEVLTVTGRWTYDARSGETIFAASVDSTGDPLGLFHLSGDAVALAAAFGPAVVSAVAPAFPGAGAVGIVGVAAAALILQGAVKQGSGRVVCTGLGIEQRQRALTTLAGSRQQLLFDYVSSFDVGIDILGMLAISTSKPVSVRYKDVGIQLDWAKQNWWEVASFVYEGVSMEIVEPGQWQIDGPLGKFLGIVAVRMGTGSVWFEVDMAFNLDLGVVRLTSATIRFSTGDAGFAVEVRGLGVAVSIPGVLEGSGSALINGDGSVSASLDVSVVAAGVTARAELELQPAFGYVAISLRVILPVGIPLANSGLGIFGFVGQFVSNGQRTMVLPLNEDPVQAELDWYVAAFAEKWGPAPGEWALGLGVIIGTLPDMAFSFNAEGMFVVTFPDPSVILGIDAKLLSAPKTPSDDPAAQPGYAPPDPSLRLVGLTVIEPDAVMIGVRGNYEIPGVIEVYVPLSAYFPRGGDARGSYVHLGSDNVTEGVGIYTRPGDPVSITLLPGVIDAKASAYFMLEERELHRLGNDERFSFDGFSIGFGASFKLLWTAGPATLDASAKVLVGLGTSPFKLVGSIEAEGEVSVKMIGSAGVEGSLFVELVETGAGINKYLKGEFCAEIDPPLAPPVRKCVPIEIGSPLPEAIPVPPHPLRGIELTDRRGNRSAGATTATAGSAHTAWPDTVPVLGFSHVPELGADLAQDWTFAAVPNNPSPWAGTSELKYAFRLDRVELLADGVKVEGPLEAAFWLPTHRGGVMSEEADAIWPSEHEGAALALLSWVPFTVFRNLTSGGEGLPADPVRTLGWVCDTITIGHETCAPGIDAQPLEPGRVRIRSRGEPDDPVAALFCVFGTATLGGLSWRELGPALAGLGLHPVADGIVDLALTARLPDGRELRRAWELPGIGEAGLRYASLGWEGRFEPAIAGGQLLLEVCDQGFGVQAPTRCFPFDDVDAVSDAQRWDSGGLRIVKTVTPAAGTGMTGAGGQLLLGTGTVRIVFPFPVSWAALGIVHPLNLATMTVRNLSGTALDTRVIPRSTALQTLVVEKLGPFSEIVIVSLDPRLALASVCVRAGLGPADGPLEVPPLVGQRLDGSLAFWEARTLADRRLADNRRCLQILYTSPDDLGWQAIGLPPMQSATIRLVGVCALTTTLEQARIRDQAARDALKDGWNLKAGLLSETRPLLAPDKEYTLRVGMSWAGWRPSSAGAQPPATVASWTALGDVDYRFRTAAEPAALPANVALAGESEFDPRAVVRYLIGFEPGDAAAPPHLLGDALLARFSVDHLEQLLAAYGHALRLALRRTDPPAGSTEGGPLPGLVLTAERLPLEPGYLDRVDARVIDAVAADPRCLSPDVNTGGVTLALRAELEPDAEYDLILYAPPAATPEDESLLVARAHFRSSRYADVNALIAALGFGVEASAPFIPFDLVVADGAAMPGSDPLASDAALEDALRTLGMDPWPLVDFGRTVAIWRPGAAPGEYLLAGLLLEAPEPLQRVPRCSVTQAQVRRGARTLATFVPARANTAGTRLLLCIDGNAEGIALAGAELVLELQMLDRVLLRSGTRAISALPRIAYQELP